MATTTIALRTAAWGDVVIRGAREGTVVFDERFDELNKNCEEDGRTPVDPSEAPSAMAEEED